MYKITPEWGIDHDSTYKHFRIVHLKCGRFIRNIFKNGPVPAKVGCPKCHEVMRFYHMAQVKKYMTVAKIASLPI